ncbi:hypothetical protein NIES4106_62200 (plasmid) [Fischerella sp. NIES-4106]|nr:hypothetical protein NIES4106_62200 [Fischerella sp. NIES-4106]
MEEFKGELTELGRQAIKTLQESLTVETEDDRFSLIEQARVEIALKIISLIQCQSLQEGTNSPSPNNTYVSGLTMTKPRK